MVIFGLDILEEKQDFLDMYDQYEVEEKYLILISSQNNLGSKENEIIKINFKENWVQKDN